ncbi:hypothetical protein ACFYW9_19365 [Streptomyces sp. NPDC002698]|uniref:hypothetical protein n=1 Tax=Streptomyces sp. NPDC002698 TaxID=3364660 RepID=UPI0036798D5A
MSGQRRTASTEAPATRQRSVPDANPSRNPTWDAETLNQVADYWTFGVLIFYTEGAVANWVDVVITDRHREAETSARLAELETELGGDLADLEVGRETFDYPHAMIQGSSQFTIRRFIDTGERRTWTL